MTITRSTSEKKALVALPDEVYKILFERSLDAMMIIAEDDLTILDINESTLRILGYGPDKLVGQPITILFPNTVPELGTSIWKKLEFHDSVITDEFRRADGSSVKLDLTAMTFNSDAATLLAITLREITEREQAVSERKQLIFQLKKALENNKTLSGLLPICAACKKIRDDDGYWQRIEQYIGEHTEAQFTHGLCPDCVIEFKKSIKMS